VPFPLSGWLSSFNISQVLVLRLRIILPDNVVGALPVAIRSWACGRFRSTTHLAIAAAATAAVVVVAVSQVVHEIVRV
jgi:hypothetical protein